MSFDIIENIFLDAVKNLSAFGNDINTGLSLKFSDTEVLKVIEDAKRNLFQGATQTDIFNAFTLAIRPNIERAYKYSLLAGEFLEIYSAKKAADFLKSQRVSNNVQDLVLLACRTRAVATDLGHLKLSKDRAYFDDSLLELLAKIYLKQRRPRTLLAVQTLVDRYFLAADTESGPLPYETQFTYLVRIVSGLTNPERYGVYHHAVVQERFLTLLAGDYMASTPTLFNAGTPHPQLSSCYLTTIPDSLKGIYQGLAENADLSKFAGGIGNDYTPVRALGSYIESTRGESQGVIPFMKVADSTSIAVNQGGKRKGAICAYLESWHADFYDFLDLRKNTGDDRRRTHDMNTAAWVPDLLILRKDANQMWSMFSPDEVPDLHELTGEAFIKRYCEYEEMGLQGKLRVFRQVPALDLWRKHLGMLFETGHPWMCFKDPSNIRNPQAHAGVVHSSNLCTEITLNTNDEEVAVCNLGSINLMNHVNLETKAIDWSKLLVTVKTAVALLDDVIDEGFYPSERAKVSNMRHRPIGLGVMGFQDMLTVMEIPHNTPEALKLSYAIQAFISLFAIDESADRARAFGKYPSYEGSTWSKGILPIDTYHQLMDYREANGMPCVRVLDKIGSSEDYDYGIFTLSQLMESALIKIKKHGMRNSNLTSIAPTATISNIVGVSQSIEPVFQNLYVKSNLSGEFTVINPYLEKALRDLDLWNAETVMLLKMNDGSVQLPQFPEKIQRLFATSFECDPIALIDNAAARQIWLDQSQSLNLYAAKPNGPLLDRMYMRAFETGCKTTYYLRCLGATQAEKSTGTAGALNAVAPASTPKACSINDPDCDACQ